MRYALSHALRTIVLAPWLALSACGPSATEGGFDSPNPAARMYAMTYAARDGDQAAVKDLICSLDSDDPAVRLLAITTLERLTGQTYGYRLYDSRDERRDAIDRWVAAYRAGEIGPNTSTPATSPDRSNPAPPHG